MPKVSKGWQKEWEKQPLEKGPRIGHLFGRTWGSEMSDQIDFWAMVWGLLRPPSSILLGTNLGIHASLLGHCLSHLTDHLDIN